MEKNTSALIIIDLQREFFEDGLLAQHREKLVSATNELVDAAHDSDIPVIWIRQEYKSDLSDAPLFNRKNNKPVTIENTDGCKLLPELHIDKDDHEIIKKRYSAFYNTNLEKLIRKLNINTLIITGINTMTCVRTTAIDAYQRDLNVILARDAIDAYDVEQHENSLKYLQYAVGREMNNEEIIKIANDEAQLL